MKKVLFGALAALFSVSVYAQFGNILQSVKDQLSDSAQQQVNQGVHSATQAAVDSTTAEAHKVIEAHGASAASAAQASGAETARQ